MSAEREERPMPRTPTEQYNGLCLRSARQSGEDVLSRLEKGFRKRQI